MLFIQKYTILRLTDQKLVLLYKLAENIQILFSFLPILRYILLDRMEVLS